MKPKIIVVSEKVELSKSYVTPAGKMSCYEQIKIRFLFSDTSFPPEWFWS